MAELSKKVSAVRVSHPGVHGCEEYSPADVAGPKQAVEAFRVKHGKIQTVHPYTVTVETADGSKEIQVNLADLNTGKQDDKPARKTAKK